MAYREVKRVADRFFLGMILIKTPYRGRPLTLEEWTRLDEAAKAATRIGDLEIEITESEYQALKVTTYEENRNNTHLPRAERGGIWYVHSGGGFGLTFDTPEKVLVEGDIWIDIPNNRVQWKDDTTDGGIEKSRLSDVTLTRDGSNQVVTVTRN